MKFKTVVLWWLVNYQEHKALKEKDTTVDALMPLVSALFPGIEYYSISGFSQVIRDCVVPALKKLHPELLTTPSEKIKPRAMTEVAAVLPSKGYEWQRSVKWQSKFQKFLVAA